MNGNHSFAFSAVDPVRLGISLAPYVMNLVLSLPSNICVLWIILARPGDKASEIFALNQAICEIAISMLTVLAIISQSIPEEKLGLGLENVEIFFFGLTFTGRLLFKTCIGMERYLAVVHPVIFLRYKPLRYRVAASVVVWLVVLALSSSFMLSEFRVISYVCVGTISTCISAQLFYCVGIVKALKRRGPGDGDRDGEGMNGAKLKAFRIIVVVTVSAILSCLPFAIVTSLFHYLSMEEFLVSLHIAAIVAVVAGVVQPLLYLHRAGKLPCIKGPQNDNS